MGKGKIVPAVILAVILMTFCVAVASGQNTADTPPATAASSVPAMQDIHDIKPPIPAGFLWRRLWLAAVVVLLAVVLAVATMLWKRRNRKLKAARTGAVSPEDQALGALNALESEMPMDARIFYFRLTGVLRYYLSRRFEIPAVEMTVEELLPCIDTLNLERDMKQALKNLFRDAEPIKFAGAAGMLENQSRDLAFAAAFVADCRPREPESGAAAA